MMPELRPRGIGEMLDAAVAVYRARFVRLVVISAVVVIPVQVLNTVVLLSAQPDGYTINYTGHVSPTYNTQSVLTQLAASLVVLFVGFISTAFVVGLCSRTAGNAYSGLDGSGGRRILAILGASTLVAGSELLGIALCGIGAIVPITFFAVALPALVLEGVRPVEALGRSAALARNHFLLVFGFVVTAHILESVLSIGLSALASLAVHSGGSTTTAAVVSQGIASAIAATLTTPFLATATVVLYFDLRIRNEGFDIQLLMQRNDARRAAPVGAAAVVR